MSGRIYTTEEALQELGLVEVVATGQPEVQLLACMECGVLLWDYAKHYKHAHRSD